MNFGITPSNNVEVDRKMLTTPAIGPIHDPHQSAQYPNTFGNRRFGISVEQNDQNETIEELDCWEIERFSTYLPICTLTCDLANAKTIIPQNFVNVMPDRTLLPILESASLARSSFVPVALQYARTMCDTNSTPIPIH